MMDAIDRTKMMIKQSGKWYDTDNYRIYPRSEFIQEICFVPSEVNFIQRQCDGYAIELKSPA